MDVEGVGKETRQDFSAIDANEFEQCFQQWTNRLDKCIKLNGEYVGGIVVV